MSTNATATHLMPIALCESGSAPDLIQILPSGAFTPNDGRSPWRVEDAASVIAETRRRLGNREMVLDYNHQSEHAAKNGRPAPAAGWISALETRPDGIYGKVSWTKKGAEAVAAREFRYISPVFNHDSEGRITRIISCALTNTPALDMRALCESAENIQPETKEISMDPKLLAQALGLPETAGEAEIIAAATAARKAMCEAQKEPDPAKYVPMEAHKAVSDELAALKKAQCEARADALVADAKAKGKLVPAMEGWAKAYAQSDEQGFKAWLESAPAFNLDRELLQGKPPAGQKKTLTEEQKQLCQTMGLDEAKYLEELQKQEGANG